MAITEDDFLKWRDNVVTQWIFAAIEKAAQAQKDEWGALSWERDEPDPAKLTELRTRADAYMALVETSYEGWAEANGEEPAREAA